jgi:hypothetical protein
VSRGRGKRTERLIAAAFDILREIQPATVRAVCYRLFVAGLIPSMEKSATNAVSRALRVAREEREVPWEWICDESREAETVTLWQDPDEIIRDSVNHFRRDNWQEQPRRVEVWSEKATVAGILRPVLDEYGVTFRVLHGYASATVINDIAELSAELDQPLVILYVGDWDPSGKHMSDVDLPRRLTQYGARYELTRIALERADLFKLPSFSLKSKRRDPRHNWFRKAVRTACYELDAMPPPLLRGRVRKSIRSHIDLGLWRHSLKIEKAQVDSMKVFHNSWQASISDDGRTGGAS